MLRLIIVLGNVLLDVGEAARPNADDLRSRGTAKVIHAVFLERVATELVLVELDESSSSVNNSALPQYRKHSKPL